jgi:hypothetical protein
LFNTIGDIGNQGKKAESNILQSVIYELGSNYIDILDKVGLDAIRTVLGFGWEYKGDDTRVDKLNNLVASMTDKISILFGIVGYTMKEFKAVDIDNLMHYLSLEEGKERDNHLIYIESIISKAIYQGMTKSLKYLGEENNWDTLNAKLKGMIIDSYILKKTLMQEDENQEIIETYKTSYDKFIQSITYFSDLNISIEEIAQIDDHQYYLSLLENAKNIESFGLVLDDFAFNVIYIWASNLITGGKLEAK